MEAKAERDYRRNTKKVKVSREGSSQESQSRGQSSGQEGKRGSQEEKEEDRTEGRPSEDQGPPMTVKFPLRVEQDAVILTVDKEETGLELSIT